MHNTLVIDKISKIFDNELKALNEIEIEILSGQIFGLLGPNGAGKSTLMRILCNLIEPTSGKISYNDIVISGNKRWTKKHISYCPQQHVIYDYLTVEENLILMAELYDLEVDYYKTHIDELLKSLGLDEKRKSYARTLSGGQKKRLSIIFSLLNSPKIILLDEPTSGLDIKSRIILINYFLTLKKKDIIIIISTHDFSEVKSLCDQIAILNQGRVVINGSPEDVSNIASEWDPVTLENIFLTLTQSSDNKSNNVEKMCDN